MAHVERAAGEALARNGERDRMLTEREIRLLLQTPDDQISYEGGGAWGRRDEDGKERY